MPNLELQKNLDAVFGAHMDAELAGDLDQTLATMAPNPYIVNVPTMVGGQGPKVFGRSTRIALSANSFRPTSSLRRFRGRIPMNASSMN